VPRPEKPQDVTARNTIGAVLEATRASYEEIRAAREVEAREEGA
jgi:hypothetical protein